jgi:hypothetical protein
MALTTAQNLTGLIISAHGVGQRAIVGPVGEEQHCFVGTVKAKAGTFVMLEQVEERSASGMHLAGWSWAAFNSHNGTAAWGTPVVS